MIRNRVCAVLSLLVLFATQAPVRAYTLQYRDASGLIARRWLTKPIVIAFSTSLASPPPNIKVGSDVVNAARRALGHWANVADVQFFETVSTAQTISPQNAGDHINLITVASDNAPVFGASDNPGRTRVFYDSSGAIVEADIALNPSVEFSSDGTAGTYDLESTFTHEVGHLLGLEHSAILGATMQPRQAINGLFNLPALTQRTLSEDDIAGARSLYGAHAGTGSISGRLIARSSGGQSRSIFGGHVFAEDPFTGRIVAGAITLASGDYRIDSLQPGSYRIIGQTLDGPVSADELATAMGIYSGLVETSPPFETKIASRGSTQLIPVTPDTSTSLGFFVTPNPDPAVRPRLIGMNGDLSTVALPLTRGKTFTVYLAGEGIDQIPLEGVSCSSPFIEVDPRSVTSEILDVPYAAISFEVTVARDTPPGQYSVVLRSIDGELIYIPGALRIDL